MTTALNLYMHKSLYAVTNTPLIKYIEIRIILCHLLEQHKTFLSQLQLKEMLHFILTVYISINLLHLYAMHYYLCVGSIQMCRRCFTSPLGGSGGSDLLCWQPPKQQTSR